MINVVTTKELIGPGSCFHSLICCLVIILCWSIALTLSYCYCYHLVLSLKDNLYSWCRCPVLSSVDE
jgi:hypothetical protein